MKAMFKNKLLVASALAVALFTGYSCDDNDDGIPAGSSSTETFTNMTALEVMQKDPYFADFLSVVNLCGEECADSLFNHSRLYTIFVPAEGSFDIPAIEERINNNDREGVFREFVKSHIANYRHSVGGEMDKDLLMLNDKYVKLAFDPETGGYTFGGNEITEKNIVTKNAIIHKVANKFDYKPSLWEALKSVSSISSFWSFINHYTTREFDPNNSILGDIVDQEQTYRDSAFYESNSMRNRLGSVSNEDSVMIMYVPNDDLWEEIRTASRSYFNYDMSRFDESNEKLLTEVDSLVENRGPESYLQYLTYSMSDQRVGGAMASFDNLPDSLAVRQVSYPRKKYPTAEFSVTESHEASNGMLCVVDALPVNPYNIWVDTIRIEPDTYTLAEDGTTLLFNSVRKDKDNKIQELNPDAVYESVFVAKNKQIPNINPEIKEGRLSNQQYFMAYQPDIIKSYDLPWVTFYVKNVLSTSYKIALITPPWFIASYEDTVLVEDGESLYKDSHLRVSVSQNGEQLGVFPSDSIDLWGDGSVYKVLNTSAIVPDRSRIDTIFLKDAAGEDFIFNFKHCENYSGISEYDPTKDETKSYTVEIKIELLAPAWDPFGDGWYEEMFAWEYSSRFLLDQIMLIPVKPEDVQVDAGN